MLPFLRADVPRGMMKCKKTAWNYGDYGNEKSASGVPVLRRVAMGAEEKWKCLA